MIEQVRLDKETNRIVRTQRREIASTLEPYPDFQKMVFEEALSSYLLVLEAKGLLEEDINKAYLKKALVFLNSDLRGRIEQISLLQNIARDIRLESNGNGHNGRPTNGEVVLKANTEHSI